MNVVLPDPKSWQETDFPTSCHSFYFFLSIMDFLFYSLLILKNILPSSSYNYGLLP